MIARGRMAAHRACMIAAVVASALFLAAMFIFIATLGTFVFSARALLARDLFRSS